MMHGNMKFFCYVESFFKYLQRQIKCSVNFVPYYVQIYSKKNKNINTNFYIHELSRLFSKLVHFLV